MSDFRDSYLLSPGDTITCAGHIYTITGSPLGYGGSAVIYPVIRSDNHLEFALKECFPRKPGRFVRRNGIVQPADPMDEEGLNILKSYRRMLSEEQTLGQKISRSSGRAISILDMLTPTSITTGGKQFTDVRESTFCLMERMDKKGMTLQSLLEEIEQQKDSAHPLRTGGSPHIYITACILEQVLLSLQESHSAGYLFGDIQEGNVFFRSCRPDQRDIGYGQLLDFGSAREFVDGKKTAPVATELVFSTDGFRPPELSSNNPELELTAAADIFSAGCLMLHCLFSRASLKTFGPTPRVGPGTFTDSDGKKVGCGPELLPLVNGILTAAMAERPEDRYPSAEAMLADILTLKEKTGAPRVTLRKNMSGLPYFVPGSRDRELDAAAETLGRSEPVFFWGLGGMGKTETAIALATRLAPTRGAYLVHFRESMRNTILQMEFEGYRFSTGRRRSGRQDSEEAEYQDRLQLLRTQFQDALLIIDNFDHPTMTLEELMAEDAFRELSSAGLHLVFTTRYPVTWQPELEIRELTGENLLSLLRTLSQDATATDQQFRDLIRETGGHTLTLVLSAKTIRASRGRVTAQMLLDALRKSTLSQENYPEVYTDQNRSRAADIRHARIHRHLQAVFNLSGMSGAEHAVMGCCAFLPEGGMDLKLFSRGLEPWEETALESLENRGWIRHSDTHMLSIHPIIREMIREDIPPTRQSCTGVLDELDAWFTNDTTRLCVYDFGIVKFIPASLETREFNQMAEYFCNAADFLENPELDLVWSAARMLCRANRYPKAKQLVQQTLHRAEALPGIPPRKLAEVYRNAVGFYIDVDWDLFHQYAQKELALREDPAFGSGIGDQRKKAELYERLCDVHSAQFRYGIRWNQAHLDAALDFGEKALRCAPHGGLLPSKVHTSLAAVYREMSNQGSDLIELFKIGPQRYFSLRRSRQENADLEMQHRYDALSCALAMRPRNESWIAVMHELLGDSLSGEDARWQYDAALKLHLAVTAPLPASQSRVYANISVLYEKLGDRKMAMKYAMQKETLTGNRWYNKVINIFFLYIGRWSEVLTGSLEDGAKRLPMLKALLYTLPLVVLMPVTLVAEIFLLCEVLAERKRRKEQDRLDVG